MFPNITEINPILELFKSQKISLSLFAIMFVFFLIFAQVWLYIFDKDFKIKRGWVNYLFKEFFLPALLLFSGVVVGYFVVAFYFNTINKNINKTPLKDVFSSYYIASIGQPEESGSTIVYDESGNQKSEKPKTLFKVYLNKIEDSHVETISLKDNAVLKVSKVNKDSFDIILPDDKAATIKKEDAPEVFNALNKIKSDEHYGEVMKMIRTREVTEEK